MGRWRTLAGRGEEGDALWDLLGYERSRGAVSLSRTAGPRHTPTWVMDAEGCQGNREAITNRGEEVEVSGARWKREVEGG